MTGLNGDDVNFAFTHHAKAQMREKGFTKDEVLKAVHDPQVRYPSLRVKHQERRIHGRVCAVVDPLRGVVVTVYLHNVRTPLRADQAADRDAVRSDRRAQTPTS